MDSGADDLVVGQASQPAHSLDEEGRKLAGIDSVSLLPHFAQSGGFRIESKAHHGSNGIRTAEEGRRSPRGIIRTKLRLQLETPLAVGPGQSEGPGFRSAVTEEPPAPQAC